MLRGRGIVRRPDSLFPRLELCPNGVGCGAWPRLARAPRVQRHAELRVVVRERLRRVEGPEAVPPRRGSAARARDWVAIASGPRIRRAFSSHLQNGGRACPAPRADVFARCSTFCTSGRSAAKLTALRPTRGRAMRRAEGRQARLSLEGGVRQGAAWGLGSRLKAVHLGFQSVKPAVLGNPVSLSESHSG